MRILHISTCDIQGGAARAAFRLVEGLRVAGHDCSMLVKQKTSQAGFVHALEPSDGLRSAKQEQEAALVWDYCIHRRRTPLSNTHFSLPIPACDVSTHELVLRADVINLHWVAGLISPTIVRRLQRAGKPLVWTLHDQRPFTGGCHYSAGCRNFEKACQNCPQLQPDTIDVTSVVLADAIQNINPDLALAFPSRWLADCAAQSALFGKARMNVIPNGLDTTVFKPGRGPAREALGLDPSAVYFLAGADFLIETRKGFDLFCAAVARCMSQPDFAKAVADKKVNFLFFGGSAAPAVEFPSRWLKRFTSDQALAQVYAACDAFILSSREDNLPNTMVESMCCGTPVLGFAIGGLPDVITSGRTGLLAPAFDVEKLAAAIRSIAFDAPLRAQLAENCAREIPPQFTLQKQADRYIALYTDELARSVKRAPLPLHRSSDFNKVFRKLLKSARRLLLWECEDRERMNPRCEMKPQHPEEERRMRRFASPYQIRRLKRNIRKKFHSHASH